MRRRELITLCQRLITAVRTSLCSALFVHVRAAPLYVHVHASFVVCCRNICRCCDMPRLSIG